MSLALLIDSVDRTEFLRRPSLRNNLEIHTRSTLDLELVSEGSVTSNTEVSQGAMTLEAASSEDPTHLGADAFDGDINTFWATDTGTPADTGDLLDNFNRADEGPPPSASWVNSSGAGLKVVSNACELHSVGGSQASTWNTSFNADQEAEVTIAGNSPGNGSVVARLATNTDYLSNHLEVFWDVQGGDNVFQFWERLSGSWTQFGSTMTGLGRLLQTGDKVKIRCDGTTISCFVNGGLFGSATNVNITGAGYTGFAFYAAGRIDDFTAGNFSSGTSGDVFPHTLDIDLGSTVNVAEVRIRQRQDVATGRISGYNIRVAADSGGSPGSFVIVKSGTFANSTAEQTVTFSSLAGRFVRVEALSSHDAGDQAALAEIRIFENTGGGQSFYRPLVGEAIELQFNGSKVFAGSIERIAEREPKVNAAWLFYQVSAVSYEQICDRHLIAKDFEEQTLQAIVLDILGDELLGEGITQGTIDVGPTIENVPFNYRTVSEAFNELAEMTGFEWWIDVDKALHFVPCGSQAAPISLTTGSQYLSLQIIKERGDYRNRQYVRAGEDKTDERVDLFVGDGEIRTFPLRFPIAEKPVVKLNTVEKTVGIRGVEEDTNYFYQVGSANLTQNTDQTKLIAADSLEVTYKGLVPLLTLVEDQSEISTRSAIEGGTGVYEAIEDRTDINRATFAFDLADGILRRKGLIPDTVLFETRETGLRPGQLLPVNLSKHALNGDFLITRVLFAEQDNTGEPFRFTVEALTGEALGGWAEFFMKLAQKGRKFVKRENEVVGPLIFLSEGIDQTDQLTVQSITAKIGEWDVDEWGHCEWG